MPTATSLVQAIACITRYSAEKWQLAAISPNSNVPRQTLNGRVVTDADMDGDCLPCFHVWEKQFTRGGYVNICCRMLIACSRMIPRVWARASFHKHRWGCPLTCRIRKVNHWVQLAFRAARTDAPILQFWIHMHYISSTMIRSFLFATAVMNNVFQHRCCRSPCTDCPSGL